MYVSHTKISIILIKKNFQRYAIAHSVAFYVYIVEVGSLLLWKFGLGSYSRFKIHWCLAPQFAVQWFKTTKFANYFGGHWRGLMDMITWTFFREVLHLIKVLPFSVLTNICLNNFFERFCWKM